MRVAVIGGGAAGFFAALSAKGHGSGAQVTVYERSDKLLAKVRVSGGGRCNVMNACMSVPELVRGYPRGARALRKCLGQFGPRETQAWFESRGVRLKAEADGRMFPQTDSSQAIIDCLVGEASRLGVTIRKGMALESVRPEGGAFLLRFRDGAEARADRVIIATGGGQQEGAFGYLRSLGHRIERPVPSLFTFNMPHEPVRQLMGVSVGDAVVRIEGKGLSASGPLLITHWGMSGPAVLKLSAFGARALHEAGYGFRLLVNWLATESEEQARAILTEHRGRNAARKMGNAAPASLPARLWAHLLERTTLGPDMRWSDVTGKHFNRLLDTLVNDRYTVSGKTTFKEEFVTCGGVSLDDVRIPAMESRIVPGLYFAGEVLDVDGITGGYNFQAAWSTGWLAGRSAVMPSAMP